MKPDSAPPAGQPPEEREALSAEEQALAERLASLRDLRFSEEQRRRGADLLQKRIVAEGGPPVAAGLTARPPRAARHLRAWLQPALRLGLAFGAVLLALLGVGGYVAAQSLPGEALYPVKRQFEEVQVSLSSPTSQAELRLSLADRRLNELQRLVERAAASQQIVRAAAEYRTALVQLSSDLDGRRLLQVHGGILEVLWAVAEPGVRQALDEAGAAARQALERTRPAPLPTPPSPTPTATAAPTATVQPSASAPPGQSRPGAAPPAPRRPSSTPAARAGAAQPSGPDRPPAPLRPSRSRVRRPS